MALLEVLRNSAGWIYKQTPVNIEVSRETRQLSHSVMQYVFDGQHVATRGKQNACTKYPCVICRYRLPSFRESLANKCRNQINLAFVAIAHYVHNICSTPSCVCTLCTHYGRGAWTT